MGEAKRRKAFAEANPSGYTIVVQPAPQAPAMYLQSGEIVDDTPVWVFVPDVMQAKVWDLAEARTLLGAVKNDYPDAHLALVSMREQPTVG